MKKLMLTIVMAALVATPVFAQWQTVWGETNYDLWGVAVTPDGTVYVVCSNGYYGRGDQNGIEGQPYPNGTSSGVNF